MKFSVILYVKDNEKTIRNVLKSIQNQSEEDFECLILDDYSHDESKKIYEEFCTDDSRFKYIRSEYDSTSLKEKDQAGISNLLNTGIQYSIGDVIVFSNGSTELLQNRLKQTQIDLSKNPNLDLICFERDFEPEQIKTYLDVSEKTIDDFLKNGLPDFWTMAFKRNTLLKKIPWMFRQPLDKIFDTQFLLTALSHQCVLGWSSCKVNVNSVKNVGKESEELSIRYLQMFLPTHQNKSSNEFTVLVTFRDEGFEVEKTIISVRLNDQNVNIQLVDDASSDGYDYENVSKVFGCNLVKNKTSRGVAGTRCIGVDHIETPFFIIFDSHMRFKVSERDFSKKFLKELKKDDSQILYANTIVIGSNTDENHLFRSYTNEDCLTNSSGHNGFLAFGPIYHLKGDCQDFDTEWCYKFSSEDDRDNDDLDAIIETPSILGATYAMSKRWWNEIRGLQNLYYWGSDEPWLSLKTFLLGGKCRMFKNWGIGHLYRNIPTYGALSSIPVQLNRLMIQFVMAPSEEIFEHFKEKAFEKFSKNDAEEFWTIFEKHKSEYEEVKTWLWTNAVRTIKDVYELNNKPSIERN